MTSPTSSGFWFMNVGEGANPRREQPDEGRAWEDCVKYGFMAMGGGESWINLARKPVEGEHVFAYLSKHGYVGYGQIVAAAVPFKDFVPEGENESLMQLPMSADVQYKRMLDPNNWDMCIGVRWLKTLERQRARNGIYVYPSALRNIQREPILTELLANFDPGSLPPRQQS